MSYAPDTLTRGYDWRDEGSCRTEDPDLFFPAGETGPSAVQAAQAKAVCHQCPVIAACRQWALTTRQHYGVWGGMTDKEREAWRRRGQRAAAGATPRNPIVVYASHQQAYDACTISIDGHIEWTGGNEIKVGAVRYSPNQTAWWVQHGGAPVGRVFTDCGHDGCVQHLTDQAMRNARKAPPVPECGTRSGYQAHRKRGEAACEPCRKANAHADWLLRNNGTAKRLTSA